MTAAIAQQALATPAILANAQVIVWVIELTYLLDDVEQRVIVVERAPLAARPDPDSLLPERAELLRVESMPADRLRELPMDQRYRYRRHYMALLRWNKAQDLGMREEDMVPHEHYDPVALSEWTESWARPRRYMGD